MSVEKPARVLVVDDMAIYRTVISGCIRETPGLELVGTANDGLSVRQKIEELKPDLVTLDMEMPGKTGIEVLEEMKNWPAHIKRPHVVVFSAHSDAGASITVKALSLGANDFVLKPTSSQGVKAISEQLIPKLLAISGTDDRRASHAQHSMSKPRPVISGTQLTRLYTRMRRLLVIASSTGGPQALEIALKPFPENFPVPIVVVQHMPPMFTKSMADRLDKSLNLSVSEAAAGMQIQPGHVYIAPGDYHVTLDNNTDGMAIALNQDDKIFGLRPAADITFNSLIHMPGQLLLAVFTGMGSDGLKGIEQLQPKGAAVLTQEEDSCVVYGMPRAIDEANLSHLQFTPETFFECVSEFYLKW